MRIKIILILFLLNIWSVSIYCQEELEPFLIEAGKNNPELQARFNEYLSALEKIPQVNKLADPQLSIGYFLLPVETRSGPQRLKTSVSQMFPWPGTLKAAELKLSQEAKSKFEVFEETKSKLYHEIRSVYYSIYLNITAIDVTAQNINILESFKRLVLSRIKNGNGTALDEILLEIEIGDIENQLALYTDQLGTHWIAFDNLINSNDKKRPEIPKKLELEFFHLDKQSIMDSILSRNHSLIKEEMDIASIQASKELAELSGMPDFSLGLDYISIGNNTEMANGRDAIMFPRIGISIPIYREKYKARVKEVVYSEIAKGHEIKSKKNLLENLLENVWKDYNDANRREELYKKQLSLGNNAIKMLESQFASGEKPLEELLRMERKILSYSLEYEKSRVDKIIAISYMDYLMGK